jgi:ELWxxDGT repeat protein
MKLAATTLLLSFTLPVFSQEPVLIKDFNTDANSTFRFTSSGITPGISTDEHMYFLADDGLHREELWRTNGTELGTQLMKDIWPGEGKSRINFTGVIGNTLFFRANAGEFVGKLWRSQGTTTSTQMVDADEGEIRIFNDSIRFAIFQDALYFSGEKDLGYELYRIEATESTATLVKVIDPRINVIWGGGFNSFSSLASLLTAVQDMIYFTASDDENGRELWKTNGTEAGTQMVKDISKGNSSTTFQQLKAFENTLIFTADDGIHGLELWLSKGTAEETYLLGDLTKGEAGSEIELLEMVGRFVYFTVLESGQRSL